MLEKQFKNSILYIKINSHEYLKSSSIWHDPYLKCSGGSESRFRVVRQVDYVKNFFSLQNFVVLFSLPIPSTEKLKAF